MRSKGVIEIIAMEDVDFSIAQKILKLKIMQTVVIAHDKNMFVLICK